MKNCNVIWWVVQTESKLDGEKPVTIQNWSILGASKDFITNVWCDRCLSVPQRVTGYLNGHSGLHVPVKHIHMMCRLCRASKWESLWVLQSFYTVCLTRKFFFCLFLRILAEYLFSTRNYICFMRRRTRSSWVPGLYDRDITLFWHCSSGGCPHVYSKRKASIKDILAM